MVTKRDLLRWAGIGTASMAGLGVYTVTHEDEDIEEISTSGRSIKDAARENPDEDDPLDYDAPSPEEFLKPKRTAEKNLRRIHNYIDDFRYDPELTHDEAEAEHIKLTEADVKTPKIAKGEPNTYATTIEIDTDIDFCEYQKIRNSYDRLLEDTTPGKWTSGEDDDTQDHSVLADAAYDALSISVPEFTEYHRADVDDPKIGKYIVRFEGDEEDSTLKYHLDARAAESLFGKRRIDSDKFADQYFTKENLKLDCNTFGKVLGHDD